MSESDEQIDKKIVWQSHIHNAKEQLIELEKARIKFNEGQNKSREKIIKELALALEDNGMPTGLISEEIIRALADEGYGVTKQYINKCLDKKYKTKLQDNKLEESETGFQNDGKNVPEQRAMAVDASTGQEEEEEEAPFEDIKRSDVIQEPERVKELEKRIDELEIENEVVKRENKILKEKTLSCLLTIVVVSHSSLNLVSLCFFFQQSMHIILPFTIVNLRFLRSCE